MNKISQKMVEIARKLSAEGLKDRAEQFVILAEDLEQEHKMKKISGISSIPKIKKQEKVEINENQLKNLLNRKLTPYNKFKE